MNPMLICLCTLFYAPCRAIAWQGAICVALGDGQDKGRSPWQWAMVVAKETSPMPVWSRGDRMRWGLPRQS